MNELSLFTGAGGGILGSHLMGWKTICAVEIEDYPRRVLLARQKDGLLPQFPIWDDVTTFDGKPWKGRVDIITGGFPCQDISCAGKGAGITGERSGLWSEMARIIGEVRPRFVLVENSPMLVRRGLAVVISDLAEMGYACKWGIVGAHHAGGPHKRDRVWILANAMCSTDRTDPRQEGEKKSIQGEYRQEGCGRVPCRTSCNAEVVADTIQERLQGCQQQTLFGEGRREEGGTAPKCSGSWWDIDPTDFPDTHCGGSQGGSCPHMGEMDKSKTDIRFQAQRQSCPHDEQASEERSIESGLGGMDDGVAFVLDIP